MITEVIFKANEVTAEKVVGLKQCKYCDGLPYCPDVPEAIESARKSEIADLGWALEIAILAEKWAGAVKSRAKEELAEGNEVKGWKLRSSGRTKSISDANKCAERITDTNQLNWTEILSASSISWSKLLKIWTNKRNKSGANLSRKDAVEELEQILDGVLIEKPKAEALVKSK
jgi:hypothetical protein